MAITNDSLSLMNLNVAPNGLVQFKVVSTDPEKHPIGPYEPPTDTLADFITVRVLATSQPLPNSTEQPQHAGYKEINVEIERLNVKKPFLGGFKNKLTNKEFHNAAIQTNKLFRPDNGVKKFSRDSQTVVSNHIKVSENSIFLAFIKSKNKL